MLLARNADSIVVIGRQDDTMRMMKWMILLVCVAAAAALAGLVLDAKQRSLVTIGILIALQQTRLPPDCGLISERMDKGP
jgi:hypothetical protein